MKKRKEYRPLTPKQAQVLRLILEGLSGKQVAESLGVVPSTVEVHLWTIYRKWKVHNRIELTKRAIELGFIPSPKQGAA